MLDVAISDCGELTGDQKLNAADANFLASYKLAPAPLQQPTEDNDEDY